MQGNYKLHRGIIGNKEGFSTFSYHIMAKFYYSTEEKYFLYGGHDTNSAVT